MQNHMMPEENQTLTGTVGAKQFAFNTFAEARRGFKLTESYAPITSGTPPFNYLPNHVHSKYPTEFAGVLRDPNRSAMMPVVRDAQANSYWHGVGDRAGLTRDKSVFDGSTTMSNSWPDAGRMFVRDSGQQPTFSRWTEWASLGAGTGNNLHADRNQSALMRNQTLMRMPNLVSDNSQVFLVRLTVGLFELNNPSSSGGIDVNDFGAEYGEAIGQTQRYKAMFIIDRSVPVGFKPGENMNVRDTILFERFYQ